MPTVGRTLAGFLCEEQALNYFAAECEESEASTEGLKALWSEAKHRLGEPAANTGNPTIEELPTEADEYVHTFLSAPSWSPIFAENPHWELKLIEIEPLLAYQFSIIDRAMDAHSADFSVPPTVNELLPTCLPLSPTPENYSVSHQGHSVLIRSNGLNLRPLQVGQIGEGAFGVYVGVGLPFVHVVRFQGKCFLHNGYHRAVAAAEAGAIKIPCVFRDVQSVAEIGLGPGTFSHELLSSNNPPTLRHFQSSIALKANLLIKTRIMQIAWTDWVVPEF